VAAAPNNPVSSAPFPKLAPPTAPFVLAVAQQQRLFPFFAFKNLPFRAAAPPLCCLVRGRGACVRAHTLFLSPHHQRKQNPFVFRPPPFIRLAFCFSLLFFFRSLGKLFSKPQKTTERALGGQPPQRNEGERGSRRVGVGGVMMQGGGEGWECVAWVAGGGGKGVKNCSCGGREGPLLVQKRWRGGGLRRGRVGGRHYMCATTTTIFQEERDGCECACACVCNCVCAPPSCGKRALRCQEGAVCVCVGPALSPFKTTATARKTIHIAYV
jgi:hypothetical protein